LEIGSLDKLDDAVEVVVTEEEILATYYPWWQGQMRRVGREALISPENCIEDWVVAHWAEEV
jgi:hypothetical protein